MNDEWRTQKSLYDRLNKEFGFEVDLCANEHNAKCHIYSSDIEQFYEQGRMHSCKSFWMNPPYSRGNIDRCIKTAYGISLFDKTVVTLTRFDPSASWFRKYIDGCAYEVRMLARRPKFIGADHAYNFPCCVSVFLSAKIKEMPTIYRIWDWR